MPIWPPSGTAIMRLMLGPDSGPGASAWNMRCIRAQSGSDMTRVPADERTGGLSASAESRFGRPSPPKEESSDPPLRPVPEYAGRSEFEPAGHPRGWRRSRCVALPPTNRRSDRWRRPRRHTRGWSRRTAQGSAGARRAPLRWPSCAARAAYDGRRASRRPARTGGSRLPRLGTRTVRPPSARPKPGGA